MSTTVHIASTSTINKAPQLRGYFCDHIHIICCPDGNGCGLTAWTSPGFTMYLCTDSYVMNVALQFTFWHW